MKKQYLILTFSIGLVANIYAQSFFEKGMIITLSGDTLRGLIAEERQDNLATEVYFKPNKETKSQRFSTDDLRAFYIAPNDYFECHTVNVKNEEKTITAKRFLYRVEAGHVSVFRLKQYGNVAFYLKKQADTSVTLLYFTVKNMETPAPQHIDTLTNANPRLLLSGQYRFGSEHIRILGKYFYDWKNYKPRPFQLEEYQLVKEVRAYNRSVHPLAVAPIFFKKEKKLPQFVLNVGMITPISPKNQLENNLFSISDVGVKWLNSSFYGYEISAGFYGTKQLKGVGVELGYSKMSNVNFDYNYKVVTFPTSTSSLTTNYKGNFKLIQQNVFLRVNYLTAISSKFSPYLSVGVAKPFQGTSVVEFADNGTNVRPTYIFWESPSSVEAFLVLGTQFAFNRQHYLKAEINFAPAKDVRLYRSLVKIGYQFSLAKK